MTDDDLDRDDDNPYRRRKPRDDIAGRPLPDTDPFWANRPHYETYAEALARSVVNRHAPALTEQQVAEREVAARDRMRRHDRLFADDFISGPEQVLVSRALAKQCGFTVGSERATGDQDQDERMPFGDAD